MKNTLITFLFLAVASYGALASVANPTIVGPVKVSSDDWKGWKDDVSLHRLSDGVEEVEVRLAAAAQSVPPRFTVSFDVPQRDMHHRWFMDGERVAMPPDWSGTVETRLCRSLPVVGFLNDHDENRLTVSCSEAKRTVRITAGLREEDCHIVWRAEFFTEAEAPLKDYVVRVRLDRRPVFFGDAIGEGTRWIGDVAGFKPLRVPEAAFDPLYSTWYSFHQNVFADAIEAECREAAALGMKAIIVDDGWQTDDTNRGYRFTGDWRVSSRRFPDFAAHVKRVQELGLKYMIWYSVPFVGPKSENYARFKGKYLSETRDHATLDPRFPEVRAFLCDTYEQAMRNWGLDGLKLDFIDDFRFVGPDPAVAENYAGRDIKSLPEAVDRLMSDIAGRITSVRPDALVEFRQSYVGPGIRQYGNMLRAGDCPGDLLSNRVRIANLRLIAGTAAVHSDMLEWDRDDTPENAARFVLASIFGTVQYSMMLRSLPADHRRMVEHWIGFSQRHRDTLLKGRFRPRHFEAFYPLIEAESEDERILAVYSDRTVTDAITPDRPTYVLNATGASRLLVEFASAPARLDVYDTFGTRVRSETDLRPGLQAVAVPPSGFLRISAVAGEQVKILPPCEKGKARLVVPTDLVWPEKPGETDVCLWKDDKFAATCVTIDDNCKPDHDWWLKLTDELGFKVTWFVITDNVVAEKNPGFSGTWADWQKLADAGHSIQSHTTSHKSQKKGEPPLSETELRAMYRDSLAAINANVTNNFACTIAYPCGEAHEEILAEYAIGARGVYGVPSAAGSINYRCTNKGAGDPAMTDMILEGTSERGPKWVRSKKELKRGLNIILYHFVHAGKTEADREKNAAGAEREMRELASHKDRLWIARFDDVMKYGQERDTATVKSELKGDTIVVSVTDRMDDKLFDYPLTVKVRLPDAWTSVRGGRFVTHDGKPYALVDIVPDRKPVILKR